MNVFPALKSVGAWLARATGYPSIAQRAINNVAMDDSVHIADDARIERGVRLEGTISIGSNVSIERGSELDGEIELAEDVRIGPSSQITGRVSIDRGTNLTEDVEIVAGRNRRSNGDVDIGRYNAIARRTTFQNRYHSTNNPGIQSRFYRKNFGEPLGTISNGPIEVGSDVWIGLDATVLSDVQIGHGAVIGAGAVVTNDVRPYSIVAGVPAQHVSWRFDEQTRERLLTTKWWDWNDEKINRNETFFRTDLNEVEDIWGVIE